MIKLTAKAFKNLTVKCALWPSYLYKLFAVKSFECFLFAIHNSAVCSDFCGDYKVLLTLKCRFLYFIRFSVCFVFASAAWAVL